MSDEQEPPAFAAATVTGEIAAALTGGKGRRRALDRVLDDRGSLVHEHVEPS